MDNTMPTPVNIKTISAQHICCGNVIMYLDQLWKVTQIEHPSHNQYISFHAERQTNTTNKRDKESPKSNKDTLYFTRVHDIPFTVVVETN